jgi:hypothetical protein
VICSYYQLFYVVYVNEFVHNGINSQTRGGVDIEFAGDILAVGHDGMNGDE